MYTIDPSVDEPVMLINTHIGNDVEEGQGVDGAEFQRELMYLDSLGKKRIKIYINSPGGSVMDGYNIYSAILKTKTPVDTINVGIAASIAGVIFMAGRNRIMMDYALFMMHLPYGNENKQAIESISKSICTMLASRSKLSEETVMKMMVDETWMGSTDALMNGFATEIEASNENNKKRAAASTANKVSMWRECNTILNSIINQTPKSEMKNIANKLGLTDDASEQSILAAIAEVYNKASEMEDLKQKLEDAKQKLEDAQQKVEDLEKKVAEASEKIEAQESEAKKAKAEVMVDDYAKIGKIGNKAEDKAVWVEKAIADFDGTKALLESLPLNKTANKIDFEAVSGKEATSALNFMAAIKSRFNNK